MKLIEALKKSEKAENTILIIRKPTKKVFGYAVRFKGDPMLEILEIDRKEDQRWGDKVEIDGATYRVHDSFTMAANLTTKLIYALRKLLNTEI